jgi:hypothetical protein
MILSYVSKPFSSFSRREEYQSQRFTRVQGSHDAGATTFTRPLKCAFSLVLQDLKPPSGKHYNQFFCNRKIRSNDYGSIRERPHHG